MGRYRVDTCFTFVLFIIGPCFFCFVFFFGYFNLLLVHLRLKHRGNVFFSVRMLEKITLQGRSLASRLRQKCQYFQRNHKKHRKDKVVVNFGIKTLKTIKALLIKRNCTLHESSCCDGPA